MDELQIPLTELEEFGLELANLAGSIALANFRRPIEITNKDSKGFDPVTNADHAIEQVLRTTIEEKYPGHGIVGEEQGAADGQSAYTWYLDPIDGTRAFMMGSPLWGTLVGLVRDEIPLFGLMAQPVLEEVFLGTPDESWLIKPASRERLHARDCRKLNDAVLVSTHPDLFGIDEFEKFNRLSSQCLLNRWGGDCYNYAMLAAGFVDLVVEDQLHAFDIVPLIPMLRGAGCIVTDWQGRPALGGGKIVAAATESLHEAAISVLQE